MQLAQKMHYLIQWCAPASACNCAPHLNVHGQTVLQQYYTYNAMRLIHAWHPHSMYSTVYIWPNGLTHPSDRRHGEQPFATLARTPRHTTPAQLYRRWSLIGMVCVCLCVRRNGVPNKKC